MNEAFDVPIALIFFNRPSCFEKVFSAVAKQQPKKLFLIQDGARITHPSDDENIRQCRTIAEKIEWPCEVFRNYAEENLGCGKRISSGLDWVFSHVEESLILEDDCIPDKTFFPYCKELLEVYRNDSRISYISGLNHFEHWDCGGRSYCFTKTGAIWGWATWKRAWRHFDYYVRHLDDQYVKKMAIKQIRHVPAGKRRFETWMKANQSNKKVAWAAQWGFVKFSQYQLVIVPKNNLINNVGVGENATHSASGMKYFKKYSNFNFIPTHPLELPLQHPPFVLCDVDYDTLVYNIESGSKHKFWIINYLAKLKRALQKIIAKILTPGTQNKSNSI